MFDTVTFLYPVLLPQFLLQSCRKGVNKPLTNKQISSTSYILSLQALCLYFQLCACLANPSSLPWLKSRRLACSTETYWRPFFGRQWASLTRPHSAGLWTVSRKISTQLISTFHWQLEYGWVPFLESLQHCSSSVTARQYSLQFWYPLGCFIILFRYIVLSYKWPI